MKYLFPALAFLTVLTISQSSFSQVKKKSPVTISLLAPPIDPIGDNPGGGGYSPPPVYGHIIPNGNSSNTFAGFQIILYEGNNATQDVIANGRISGSATQFIEGRFQKDVFTRFIHGFLYPGESPSQYDNLPANDETRSLRMCGMVAGRAILIFDSPSAATNDDWTEILIKKAIPGTDYYQLDSYEHSYEDEYVKVTYHADNGLDGKVSYMRIYMTN
jgi:hypothetical protein